MPFYSTVFSNLNLGIYRNVYELIFGCTTVKHFELFRIQVYTSETSLTCCGPQTYIFILDRALYKQYLQRKGHLIDRTIAKLKDF